MCLIPFLVFPTGMLLYFVVFVFNLPHFKNEKKSMYKFSKCCPYSNPRNAVKISSCGKKLYSFAFISYLFGGKPVD